MALWMAYSMIRRRCHFDPGSSCARVRKRLRVVLPRSRSKRLEICGPARIRWCSSAAITRPLSVAAKPMAGRQVFLREPPPAPQTDNHAQIGLPFFEYFVFDNPDWDFRSFDWTSDPAYVDHKVVVPGQTLASVLNSIDPDLERFRARGGKLIQYHGFSDPEVPPLTSINYFESVVNFRASHFGSFFARHCPAIAGADSGVLPALHGAGHEPLQRRSGRKCIRHAHAARRSGLSRMLRRTEFSRRITSTTCQMQGVAFTRPLCSYPQEAVYKGSGNTNDAANFVCK